MHQDANKTNSQLSDELRELRQRNIELEVFLANSQEAEENLRAVSETAVDAVIISDQDGNIIFWNKRATEIFGYEKEEVIGNPITMLISDEAMGEYNEGKEDVLERGVSLFGKRPKESVAKRKDGTKFLAEFTVSNWKVQDKYYFGGSLRDISEQKRVEEEYKTIINMSQDLICIAEMDGYFKYVNPAWERILGYTKEELLTRPFLDFIHPEDHYKNDAAVETLSSGKILSDFENRYHHKDGSIRSFNWTAVPLPEKGLMYCIGRNITDRKQIEMELINTKDFLENIYNTTPDVLMVSDEKGYVIRVNKAVEKMLGFTQEELIGKHTSELFPNDEKHAQIGSKMITELRGKGFIKSLEANWVRKDGSLCPVELNITKLQDSDGKRIGAVAAIRDFTERKQQEEMLKESEERFRTVAEFSSDAIFISDQNGTIIFWNRTAVEMFGYEERGIVGKSYIMLLPERLREQDQKAWQQFFKTSMQSNIKKPFETVALRKDSSEFPVEITFSGWKAQSQYYFSFIIRDITDRKQAEQVIITTKEFLESVYNTTPDVLLVTDGNGYITNVNKAVEIAIGFSQKEMVGKHASELFPKGEKYNQIREYMVTELLEKGFLKNYEANWVRKDGSLCPIEFNITLLRDKNGNKLGGVATVRDITERKKQEEAVREREERFRTMAESSNDAIITADSSGKILYWNKAAEAIYGYAAEEIVGKSIELLRPEEKRLTDRKNRERFLKTGESSYIGKMVEGLARKKDGTKFLTETSTSYWTMGGQIIFCGIVRDITERKQMEAQLRQAHVDLEKKVKQRTAELRRANEKLQISEEYLKKFAGMLLLVREEERKNISTTLHDELGSMALSVTSKITIAKEECNNNNKHGTFAALEQAQAAVRKAVEDLRRVAVDLRPPNLEIMGLTAAVTELLDKVKEQAKFKIIFRNELGTKKIPEDMAIVIYRVIQESLTNSIKHAKAKTVRIRLYADKGNIYLDIADDGIGCDLNKALYRKGKLKIGIEGMRERVESLGGEFTITSAPSQGTQLKVTMPQEQAF